VGCADAPTRLRGRWDELLDGWIDGLGCAPDDSQFTKFTLFTDFMGTILTGLTG
jgi:hypothetical protein